MATYNRKFKELLVFTMDGNNYSIIDTVENKFQATRALNEFKRHETMHYVDKDSDTGDIDVPYAIPYHAVTDVRVVNETDESVSRANPYGCEDPRVRGKLWASGEADGIGFIVSPEGQAAGGGTSYMNYASWKDLCDNHQNYTVTAVLEYSGGEVKEINVPWDAGESRWDYGVDGTQVEISAGADGVGVTATDESGTLTSAEIYVKKN